MKVVTSYAGARPRFCALSSAVAAALAGLSSAGYAQAQEPAAGQRQVDEITVTGSRIVRQDFDANSPIQTVDQQMFDETSAIGVETILNRLPQFVPAVTQFTTTDVQQTATNTVGASTVSLRGLGPNRNLVLINGRRAMPVDPRMVVDTNSIPASAIQRVEVISGGASAVYGADAVGGVVNFILKDDYEGASIDVRFGDTQHGGDQTVDISALFGVNAADDRGNIMLGIERSTRSKELAYERDWRLADMMNPRTAGGGFAFGSSTYFTNEPLAGTDPNPNFNPAFPVSATNNPRTLAQNFVPNPAFNPALPPSATNPTVIANNPNQTAVNNLFAGRAPGSALSNNVAIGGGTRFRMNRDGTVYTGLQDGSLTSPGSYRFNGPVFNGNDFCNAASGTCPQVPGGGDLDGDFKGLPAFVRQVNGQLKENLLYGWASTPLERLSAFSNGHFDIAENLRVTGQAMVTRTKTESSLALTAANVNQWGAGIPFGTELFRGSTNEHFAVPDSLIDVDNSGGLSAGDQTHPDYLPGGRFGLNCEAANSPAAPWADGQPGCTNSEAWPTSPEIYNLYRTRPSPNDLIWASREPDWMRSSLGRGRSTTNTTTTMSFTLGLEGDLPSGDHSWDVSIYTGRSDNTVNQLGSMRLETYRDVLASPNWGRNATFDVNPWEFGNFAEGIPTCTTGLPIVQSFEASQDCLQMISPALKNIREMTQTILEANLVGDLAEMRNGPLQYALGYTYRENGFSFTPDNLSDIQNEIDSIAGLFPNEASAGEFDVSEIYGELLIPIIEDGPIGVEHFNLEIGARVSDWSMPQMPNLNTYKALMDWAVSPRYRIRGGFNRAFRAPNLGELYSRRTQLFGGGGATRDWCSQNLASPGTFSATPTTGPTGTPNAQNAQSVALCRALMGPSGAEAYYDNRALTEQPTAGGLGVPITFGNELLREEQADTWTIGVAMDILEDFRLTVDWYQIVLEDMIAAEGLDATYQRCLDMQFNPTGDINNEACLLIKRSPNGGGGATVDRTFTNEGRADFSGVDLALTWNKQLAGGGGVNLNVSANAPLHEITQDRASLPETDWAGYNQCGLGLQCQNYDYRLFTTVGYGLSNWNISVRHQYWPELQSNQCRTNPATAASISGCDNNTLPGYGLFSLSGNYRLDRYTISGGIENLLDEEPPCTGANPLNVPTTANPYLFPTDCTRTGDASTYDPLGRRFFVSVTMDF
jgi:iron complex outermembrane recepter protein